MPKKMGTAIRSNISVSPLGYVLKSVKLSLTVGPSGEFLESFSRISLFLSTEIITRKFSPTRLKFLALAAIPNTQTPPLRSEPISTFFARTLSVNSITSPAIPHIVTTVVKSLGRVLAILVIFPQ